MPKTKTGEKITWKEALKRFKEGVERITPQQKLANELRATFINLIGYILGIVVLIWQNNAFGWLSYALILIFIGNSWSTGLKILSLRQQQTFFKNIEEQLGLEEEKVTIVDGEEKKKMGDLEIKIEKVIK